MPGILSFVLLIAALLLFLVSTRQWPLMVRGAVWGAGALLLIIAWIIVSGDGHRGGLFEAFGDLLVNGGDGISAKMLGRNWRLIGEFVLPLLDLFLIIGAALGILALIAFSPGEALERITRPLGVLLVGAILGGMLALTVVGVGFGAPTAPGGTTYINPQATAEDALEGDTILVDRLPLRLRGIDAPEPRQTCRDGRRTTPCGDAARQRLASLISGASLECETTPGSRPQRSDDNFGRLLVTCIATRGGEEYDVGRSMVADGYAIEYRGEPGEYARAAQTAYEDRINLMAQCTLRPDIWRDDAGARTRFISRGATPANPRAVMGRQSACPRRPPPPPSSTDGSRPG